MAIEQLIIPYDDFQTGQVIDPEQFDLNNLYIKNKVNEIVLTTNTLTSSGAEVINVTPPPPFESTNIQALFDEINARLTATTLNESGADYIGSTSLSHIPGDTVGAQLRALNTALASQFVGTSALQDLSVTTPKLANLAVTTPKLADLSVTGPKLAWLSVGTEHIIAQSVGTGKIANRAVTGDKIGLQTIKQENVDPSLLELLPQTLLTQKVLVLEDEMDIAQFQILNMHRFTDPVDSKRYEYDFSVEDGKLYFNYEEVI
jgi:hypothetical protein